jgi:hypothetical protein
MSLYKHIYQLPEELIDIIFSYNDPYQRQHKRLIYQLSWKMWWRNAIRRFFPNTASNFYKYILEYNRNTLEYRRQFKKNKTNAIETT